MPPTVTVVKDADPVSRPEPGGSSPSSSSSPTPASSRSRWCRSPTTSTATSTAGARVRSGRCSSPVPRTGASSRSTTGGRRRQPGRPGHRHRGRQRRHPGQRQRRRPHLDHTRGRRPAARERRWRRGGPARLAFGLLLAGILMLGVTMRRRHGWSSPPSGRDDPGFTGPPTRVASAGSAGLGISGRRAGGPARGGRPRGSGPDDVDPDDDRPDDQGATTSGLRRRIPTPRVPTTAGRPSGGAGGGRWNARPRAEVRTGGRIGRARPGPMPTRRRSYESDAGVVPSYTPAPRRSVECGSPASPDIRRRSRHRGDRRAVARRVDPAAARLARRPKRSAPDLRVTATAGI